MVIRGDSSSVLRDLTCEQQGVLYFRHVTEIEPEAGELPAHPLSTNRVPLSTETLST